MRTFTFTDGSSNKFWNIELKGNTFEVTFGKVGSKGQTQIKAFPDEAKAKKEHDKLVGEKLGKGYVETTSGAAAAKPATPAPAPAKPQAVKAPAPAAPPPAPAPAPAAAGGLRTFALSDASSHKFWNVELKGKSFTVTYGRQGTAGQTQVKDFADEAKAKKEHDKLIAEKLGKGYLETTPTAAPAPKSLREALESALVANPEDLASHMAYADYLTDQGEPWGQLIRIHLALEDPSKSADERKGLQKQEKKLLNTHAHAHLGDLAPFLLEQKPKKERGWGDLKIDFTFARGWLDTLEVSGATVAFGRALARAPQARLLRQLLLNEEAYEEEGEYEPGPDLPKNIDQPGFYPLARSPYLTNVRVLRLGELFDEGEEASEYGESNCHNSGEVAVGLVRAMPRLEELRLLAHNVDGNQLFAMKLDHLRVLQLYHSTKYPLAKLAENSSLTNLTHLLLHPHALEDEKPYIDLAGIRALVHSTRLPALTHLQIRLTNAGDKAVKEIVESGILKRLKVLDLRHGNVTDKGAKLFADCPDLKHLELLDLGQNALTQEGIAALRATGVKVKFSRQHDPEDDEYLGAGDIE